MSAAREQLRRRERACELGGLARGLLSAYVVAGENAYLGEQAQQLEARLRARRRRLREHALDQRGSRLERELPPCALGGLQRDIRRALPGTGIEQVMRDLGERLRRLALERVRDREVQLGAALRGQIVVQRLDDQAVHERVARRTALDEDAEVDGRRERVIDRARRLLRDLDEDGVKLVGKSEVKGNAAYDLEVTQKNGDARASLHRCRELHAREEDVDR